MIQVREPENRPDRNNSDIWIYEFYEELMTEIDSIMEEVPEIETDAHKTDPSQIRDALEARKKVHLFNRTARKIVSMTRKKEFDTAELLRGHLFKINPKASSEIYKIGQFIEREKRKHEQAKPEVWENNIHVTGEGDRKQPITKKINGVKKSGSGSGKHADSSKNSRPVEVEFMGCWFDLYLNMTGDECISFRKMLKKQIFDSRQRIIEQYQPAARLFFINGGTALITESVNGKSLVVKKLKSGDIAGAKSFFNGKANTSSVTVDPGAVVEYIEKEDLNKLKIKHPELVGKLQIYCQLKK